MENMPSMGFLAVVGTNILLVLTMFGTTVMLHLSGDKKITEMKNEMKDFHGRLCAIEERNRK